MKISKLSLDPSSKVKAIVPRLVRQAFLKTRTRPCRACPTPGRDRKCCALGAMYQLETGIAEEETEVIVSHFEPQYGKHYLRGFVAGWDANKPDWEAIHESESIRNYRSGHKDGIRCWQEEQNVQVSFARA